MKIPPRLTSRKLWLAVAAFIICAANSQWTEAVAVVMAYIGVEGAADTAERITGHSPVTPQVPSVFSNEIDEVDTSRIEPGNMPMFDEDIKKD